jgi:hypothetical protein
VVEPEVLLAQQSKSESLYRCRGCRQPLFSSDNVIPHAKGIGQEAFSW